MNKLERDLYIGNVLGSLMGSWLGSRLIQDAPFAICLAGAAICAILFSLFLRMVIIHMYFRW